MLFRPPWWRDLKDYYGTPTNMALDLGTRYKGRRPVFPVSRTCPDPPRGQTLEEIWASRPRDTPEAKEQFWRDVGPWCSFRQVVRNRRRSFAFIARWKPTRFLEWGAGVCPVSHWLLTRSKTPPNLIVVVDVESEHFTFGQWRLGRVVPKGTVILPVSPAYLFGCPEGQEFDAAAILETLEHVPNPLETIRWIGNRLVTSGWLYEDFHAHRLSLGDEGTPWDLPEAQAERSEVYRYLEKDFCIVSGRDWNEPDGGGMRTWRKR